MTPIIDKIENRIPWVDYAKSMAIYLIVLLHTWCVPEISIAINGFVMPTFFFLSGFLFSFRRNPDFGKFAYKRFRQLVVPFLWIGALAYMAWLLVLRRYGANTTAPDEWYMPLVANIIGLPSSIEHDIPIWSFLSFFVVEIVYYAASRCWRLSNFFIAAVSILGAVFAAALPFELPLALTPSLGGLFFYACGRIMRNHPGSSLMKPDLLWMVVGGDVLAICLKANSPTSFYLGNFGNPLFFVFGAFGGIILLTQTAMWLAKLFGDGKFIRFLSQSTLIICGFHMLLFPALKGVGYFGLHLSLDEVYMLMMEGPWRGILFAAAAYALCLPIAWLIERYARPLVAK